MTKEAYQSFKTGHNNQIIQSPIFNDAYSFQEQVQRLVYNFKMHPIYAYHMLLNQRLKQQQLIHDANSPESQSFHEQCSQQSQQMLDYNNQQYDHYAHYNQQQNMLAFQQQNQTTPFMHKQQLNYQQMAVPNQLKFSQMNISPIPYMLPQTPPNSFNQTPVIKKHQDDNKSFNSFATPPSSASFSYYTNIQHH